MPGAAFGQEGAPYGGMESGGGRRMEGGGGHTPGNRPEKFPRVNIWKWRGSPGSGVIRGG